MLKQISHFISESTTTAPAPATTPVSETSSVPGPPVARYDCLTLITHTVAYSDHG